MNAARHAVGLVLAVHNRLGCRGRSLLVFALIDIVQGWAMLDAGLRAQAQAAAVYGLLSRWVPLQVWGMCWLVVAVVCVVQAWMRDDVVAFGCAISVKVIWAVGLYGAWLFDGVPRAWVPATVWLGLALLVVNIAGWTEPVSPAFWPKVPTAPRPPEPLE